VLSTAAKWMMNEYSEAEKYFQLVESPPINFEVIVFENESIHISYLQENSLFFYQTEIEEKVCQAVVSTFKARKLCMDSSNYNYSVSQQVEQIFGPEDYLWVATLYLSGVCL